MPHNHQIEIANSDADVVFEVSWEICNKVGGIYTVIMSKAAQAVKHNKNYICIGPYFHEKALGEFEETSVCEEYKKAFEELKKQGIECRCGKWLIKGEPKVILIDFSNIRDWADKIKKDMWDLYKIDSLNAPYEYNEPAVWSYAAGMLIELLSQKLEGKKVAQFHEWLSAIGLLYLKNRKIKVGTVFTTHATTLGRSIASTRNLYSNIEQIDAAKESYKLGVPAKHLTEKAGAEEADVFTTVSEITGMEAGFLLGKKPDVILPNGLDLEEFPSFEDVSIKHAKNKFRIKEFLLYKFFPYQTFNIDETLIYFIFARYEFQNKGIDVFIEALGKLNEQLKAEGIDKTIITFFFVPAGVKAIKHELIETREYYEDIRESVDNYQRTLRNRLLIGMLEKKKLDEKELFKQEFITEVKKKLLRFKREGTPTPLTHDLFDEKSDAILNSLKTNNLNNNDDDRVKTIFYPVYLTGADGLLDLDYYETIIGAHFGVFPSAYEPWGYTPLEAGALGVASVTTDLAGFGKYISQTRPKQVCDLDHCDVLQESGIYIIRRFKKAREEIVKDLFAVLSHYAHLDKKERIDNKIEARRLAALADWKSMYGQYIKAYNMALQKWN